MFVVFVAHLARPAPVEADALASLLGVTAYEARLALSPTPPAIVHTTPSRDRAADVAAALRGRGHGAHVFDDDAFVPSEEMTSFDDFRLDADGVRRVEDGALLPYGDVFAILRGVHRTSGERANGRAESIAPERRTRPARAARFVTRFDEREGVAYFFRRSGERPWILRERHANYAGLLAERGPVAFVNFVRTVDRVRAAATMSTYDDRLVRRQVPERTDGDTSTKSSREGVDLLAHLLAMSIASQGGSPYR